MNKFSFLVPMTGKLSNVNLHEISNSMSTKWLEAVSYNKTPLQDLKLSNALKVHYCTTILIN